MSLPETQTAGTDHRAQRRWIKLAAALVVLLAGVGIALALVQTGPRAQREPPPKQARLVEIQKVETGLVTTAIEAMGTVIPAQEVVLNPQVNGEVLSIGTELVPGGLFRLGEELLQIDPADYELALRQRKSELEMTKSNLQIEQGQQAVARREFELLGEPMQGEDSDLMLRKPQLMSSRAQVDMAKASLERARLDLERTRIRAPFNAIVRARHIDVGARVTSATPLATLIGTDRYWIEVAVPVDKLKWLEIPRSDTRPGSSAQVYDETAWGQGIFRTARILRLAGDLEEKGRMARLMLAVDDPLALESANAGAPPLLIDSYVRVVLEGRQMEDVIAVDRNLVRDGNRVWIMDENDALRISTVEIRYRDRDQVFIAAGLKAGDRLVKTDLAAPVEGMPLRLAETDGPPAEPTPGKRTTP